MISKIEYEEPNIFKLVWNELKKEDNLIENNDELNKKLKNYVILNDEKNLWMYFNNIFKLKEKDINYGSSFLKI